MLTVDASLQMKKSLGARKWGRANGVACLAAQTTKVRRGRDTLEMPVSSVFLPVK